MNASSIACHCATIGLVSALVATAADAQSERRRLEVDLAEPETAIAEVVGDAVAQAESAEPGVEVSLNTHIRFRLNSAELGQGARNQLATLAAILNAPDLKERRFLIEGHTDASGSAGYNESLSRARANAVYAFLVGSGVDGSRLATRGFGESMLLGGLAPTDPRNRRVEFLLLQ